LALRKATQVKYGLLKAFDLDNLDLALWHSFGLLDKFGLEHLTLDLMLIFGFILGLFFNKKVEMT